MNAATTFVALTGLLMAKKGDTWNAVYSFQDSHLNGPKANLRWSLLAVMLMLTKRNNDKEVRIKSLKQVKGIQR